VGPRRLLRRRWRPDTPARRYRNLFTGEAAEVVERDGRPALLLATVLGSFPVALLEREPEDAP